MPPSLRDECIRVPVTALASCNHYLIAGEGPYIRIYQVEDFRLLASKRVFASQAVHGIEVYSSSSSRILLIVWGGPLLRLVEFKAAAEGLVFDFSKPAQACDWILDLSVCPEIHSTHEDEKALFSCAAVTARNALLALNVEHTVKVRSGAEEERVCCMTVAGEYLQYHIYSPLKQSISQLVASSRCVLYSANVTWLSRDRILIAAGTAFGEILVWSWTHGAESSSKAQLHHVLTGHEGSVFGVCVSQELMPLDGKGPRRLLASCSDDRSIRLWNISELSTAHASSLAVEGTEIAQIRETGFGSDAPGSKHSTSSCVAIGWGHMSRVWTVEFLTSDAQREMSMESIELMSTGEDATSRLWRIGPNAPAAAKTTLPTFPFSLQVVSTAAYHNGKNIWSSTVLRSPRRLVTGGADSKIIVYPLTSPSSTENTSTFVTFTYPMTHYLSKEDQSQKGAPPSPRPSSPSGPIHRPPKKPSDLFRSYAFIDDRSFLFTTNLGNVFIQHVTKSGPSTPHDPSPLSFSLAAHEVQALKGYSVACGVPSLGVAFLGGKDSKVYVYCTSTSSLWELFSKSKRKVGGLYTVHQPAAPLSKRLPLLVTLVESRIAYLLFVDLTSPDRPSLRRIVKVPLSGLLAGYAVTSMAFMAQPDEFHHLVLGFRSGTIQGYLVPKKADVLPGGETVWEASLNFSCPGVHANESVTALLWLPWPDQVRAGYLVSVGRDGSIAVHGLWLPTGHRQLLHNTPLPFGPNIEGVCVLDKKIAIYGFQNTQFLVYDAATEQELLNITCGGAHRSWDFTLHHDKHGGGTLVWTQDKVMKLCPIGEPSHRVVRDGLHGREIKAVATLPAGVKETPAKHLIATGAEDTLIKILVYETELDAAPSIKCCSTLRKHTTGIQHLQWSWDGTYLFSSGGMEEFYVWRIRWVPIIGVGAVCESFCPKPALNSDLRIMAFDVQTIEETLGNQHPGYIIAMVYSNSTVRVLKYMPSAPEKWQLLFTSTYATSCLTHCNFLSTDRLLTSGTDGHVVFWKLQPPFSLKRRWPGETPLSLYHRKSVHQSSVKTLFIHPLCNGYTLMVTGGDDCALAFTVISPDHVSDIQVVIRRAHASAVTACAAIDSRGRVFVLTLGTDQKVILWELRISLTELGKSLCAGEGAFSKGQADAAEDEKRASIPSRTGSLVQRYNETLTESPGGGVGAVTGKVGTHACRMQIRPVHKCHTPVADVSGMALLPIDRDGTMRVLICGVGTHVLVIDEGDEVDIEGLSLADS